MIDLLCRRRHPAFPVVAAHGELVATVQAVVGLANSGGQVALQRLIIHETPHAIAQLGHARTSVSHVLQLLGAVPFCDQLLDLDAVIKIVVIEAAIVELVPHLDTVEDHDIIAARHQHHERKHLVVDANAGVHFVEQAADLLAAEIVVANQVVEILKDRASIRHTLLKLDQRGRPECAKIVRCPGTGKAIDLERPDVIAVCV